MHILSLLHFFIFSSQTFATPIAELVHAQAEKAQARLEMNLDRGDIATGVVIASPSKDKPDYFYHWIRDAALTMETYVFLREHDAQAADLRLHKWLTLESHLQTLVSDAGLGEPRYNVDGTLYTGEWGRPQNDGPALRAHTMILWANQLLRMRRNTFIKVNLAQTDGPLHRDLDYIMAHWRDNSFDIWEETRGDHFFNRLAQSKALALGAQLFQQMGDLNYAKILTTAAIELQASLNSFWSEKDAVVLPNINTTATYNPKKKNLDIAVILASVYITSGNDAFSVSDDRIISTMKKLKDSFSIYEINRGKANFMIGRYAEDVYDGAGFTGGNPWFLTTAGFIQAQCRLKKIWAQAPRLSVNLLNVDFIQELLPIPMKVIPGETIVKTDSRFDEITQSLQIRVDASFRSLMKYIGPEGEMSEEFRHLDGALQGAADLSWSYSSFLRAAHECGYY